MNERRPFLRKCVEGSAMLSAFFLVGMQLPENRDRGAGFTSYVAGAPYRVGFETRLDSVFYPGQKLRAVREPGNIHDESAIALYAGNEKLGYIPRQDNIRLRGVLENHKPISATVMKVDNDRPWDGVELEIQWI